MRKVRRDLHWSGIEVTFEEFILQQCYEVDGRCYAVPGVDPVFRADSRAELQDKVLDLLIPFANGETVDYEQVQ